MLPFRSKLRFAFAVAVIISSFFSRAGAQGRQSGEIRGTVTDQSQALLDGVKVTITNVSTGVSKTVGVRLPPGVGVSVGV